MHTLLSSKWEYMGAVTEGFLFRRRDVNLDHQVVLCESAKLVDVETNLVIFFEWVDGQPSIHLSKGSQRRIASGETLSKDETLHRYATRRLDVI